MGGLVSDFEAIRTVSRDCLESRPNALKITKETTHFIMRWTRRASTVARRRTTATRRGTNRDAPAQVVGKEKAFVEGETAKAEKEAALVAVIQKDVGEKQRSATQRLQ